MRPSIKTKRERYDPEIYNRLTTEFLQTIQTTPHLKPSRDEWDIEGDWNKTGTMHFIDKVHQARFEPFHDFDCRTIKLVNYGQPAVRITFYPVHKYWLIKAKDLSPDERAGRVEDYVNQLVVNIEIELGRLSRMNAIKRTEALGKVATMQDELTIWSQIQDNPDEYEVAVSNYHRDHIYTNINWKYFVGDFDYSNTQMHLLNPQRDRQGNISQVRHNVVFIDTVEILRDHPYQHKTVELYLNRFTSKSSFNRDHLYVRLRPETDDVATFEAKTAPTTDLLSKSIVPPKKRPKPLPPSPPLLDLFS